MDSFRCHTMTHNPPASQNYLHYLHPLHHVCTNVSPAFLLSLLECGQLAFQFCHPPMSFFFSFFLLAQYQGSLFFALPVFFHLIFCFIYVHFFLLFQHIVSYYSCTCSYSSLAFFKVAHKLSQSLSDSKFFPLVNI